MIEFMLWICLFGFVFWMLRFLFAPAFQAIKEIVIAIINMFDWLHRKFNTQKRRTP
jgi:hypothetical protein